MVARLSGPLALDTAGAVVYSNGGESTKVVSGLHVANVSTVAIGFSLYLLPKGVTQPAPSQALWLLTRVPGNGVYDWTGSIPVDPGESLFVSANNTGDLVIMLTG